MLGGSETLYNFQGGFGHPMQGLVMPSRSLDFVEPIGRDTQPSIRPFTNAGSQPQKPNLDFDRYELCFKNRSS